MSSGGHPYFTYYFQPGDGYLGGDFFFQEEGIGDCITYIYSLNNPLEEALMHHLTVSGLMLAAGKKVCNFLIHPSRYQQDVSKVLAEMLGCWVYCTA
ncbi:hypothetical protein [Robinsoniella peoriensis]|uniref:hypothetical protein n=1 Tax=Robinsoniella peoriensis TaxID=180332 RepID=UPI000693EBB0|nr:hypothetical protein [Robinsoniella peoriensis]